MPPKPPQKFKQLPTEQEWLQATTITTGWYVHRRKNVDLLAIDMSLRNYWVSAKTDRANDSGAARVTRRRIQALNLLDIIKKCRIWIEHKTNGRKIDSSNRADMVRVLSLCAKMELDKMVDDVGGLDQVGHKSHTPNAGSGMAPHKASPAERMGARVRWAMIKDNLHIVGKKKALVDATIYEANIGGINPTHMEGHALRDKFLNQAEYKFLFDFARQAKQIADDIVYLTADERWPHQIRIEGGLAYRLGSPNGDRGDIVPARTNSRFIVSLDLHLYLVDEAKMRASTENQAARTGRSTSDRHSSFMAGQPVFFAGSIETDNAVAGKIVTVGNDSGHYRPNFTQFKETLCVLRDLGVDLTAIRARLLNDKKVWFEGMEDSEGIDVICSASASEFMGWNASKYDTVMKAIQAYQLGVDGSVNALDALGVKNAYGHPLNKTVPPPSQPVARPAAKPSWSPFRR